MPTFKVTQGGIPAKQPKRRPAASELSSTKKIYRLVGDREPEVVLIKTSSAWGIDEDGRRKLMRLAAGASSIWIEEQMRNGEDRLRVIPLEIHNGRLILNPDSDYNTIEFLKHHIGNQRNNGDLFYEYNPHEISEQNVANEERVLDAKQFIRTMLKEKGGAQKVFNIAQALKLPVSKGYTDAMLKEAMFAACETDPDMVMNAFDDPLIKAIAYIEFAHDKGELIYTGSAVKWAGGEEIMKVPQGRPWKEYLAEYATQLENLLFLKELEKFYNGK